MSSGPPVLIWSISQEFTGEFLDLVSPPDHLSGAGRADLHAQTAGGAGLAELEAGNPRTGIHAGSAPETPVLQVMTSCSPRRLSGLWHQAQASGRPFRNTVVRIPGPPRIEERWMSKIRASGTGDPLKGSQSLGTTRGPPRPDHNDTRQELTQASNRSGRGRECSGHRAPERR